MIFRLQELKACKGMVNFATGRVTTPLRCTDKQLRMNDIGGQPAITGSRPRKYGYDDERLFREDGSEILKKKWDDYDGSIQPF